MGTRAESPKLDPTTAPKRHNCVRNASLRRSVAPTVRTRLRIGVHVGQLFQRVPGGIGHVTEMLCTELPEACRRRRLLLGPAARAGCGRRAFRRRGGIPVARPLVAPLVLRAVAPVSGPPHRSAARCLSRAQPRGAADCGAARRHRQRPRVPPPPGDLDSARRAVPREGACDRAARGRSHHRAVRLRPRGARAGGLRHGADSPRAARGAAPRRSRR